MKGKQVDSRMQSQYDFVGAMTVERKRQDEQWGGPAHDDQHTYQDWVRFIRKQLDEILMVHGDKARLEEAMRIPANYYKFHERMVKVATLAMAAVESTERKVAKI